MGLGFCPGPLAEETTRKQDTPDRKNKARRDFHAFRDMKQDRKPDKAESVESVFTLNLEPGEGHGGAVGLEEKMGTVFPLGMGGKVEREIPIRINGDSVRPTFVNCGHAVV